MNLVIVESPTKAKTIGKFLGKDYNVESSFGHIMDLPKSTLGVDTDNNYQPQYVVPTKAKAQVKKLKELAKKAENIILATDEDREGEAIAWHLAETLKLKDIDIKRIVFHEITKNAITQALNKPRGLDKNLIDAQQARRVLDRLVGYKLSPFLWKKIARGLSAGRVQSVAMRLIVDRETEINNFKKQEYWTIQAAFTTATKQQFTADLIKIKNQALQKFDIINNEQAQALKQDLETCVYKIAGVEKKQTTKSPAPPFTTATLQQTANARLGFSAKQTMTLAQKLYETGLITYMRTDSVNLSAQFITDARNYIEKNFGKNYLSATPRVYKAKSKNAQEAHEAIRPTNSDTSVNDLKNNLDSGQKKLYELIWRRALATQAESAILNNTIINIDGFQSTTKKKSVYQLRANGQIIAFDGFLKIYPQATKENILPDVNQNTSLNLHSVKPEQHMTEPPARYSDATLVKAMEKYDIGRPSTYAPTISTIIARNYVERDEKKRLAPTEMAFIVNKLLVEHFPDVVDYKFTAELEDDLDKIASGKAKWDKTIDNFYKPFIKNLEKKNKELNKKELTEEKTDEKCEKCGSNMIVKIGRFGKFIACSNYPECKTTKQITTGDKDHNGQKDSIQLEELAKKYAGVKCDKCGSDMVGKIGRFGPFIACANYPKCKNILDTNGTGIHCPQCDTGEISKKRGRRGIFYACNQYPECKFTLWAKPTGQKCEKCSSLMVEGSKGVTCSNRECK